MNIKGLESECVEWIHVACSSEHSDETSVFKKCAISQAISYRLLFSETRVHSVCISFGVCGGQIGIAAGFLRIFIFLLPVIPKSLQSLVCHSGLIH
jgi:hypothetical protein